MKPKNTHAWAKDYKNFTIKAHCRGHNGKTVNGYIHDDFVKECYKHLMHKSIYMIVETSSSIPAPKDPKWFTYHTGEHWALLNTKDGVNGLGLTLGWKANLLTLRRLHE